MNDLQNDLRSYIDGIADPVVPTDVRLAPARRQIRPLTAAVLGAAAVLVPVLVLAGLGVFSGDPEPSTPVATAPTPTTIPPATPVPTTLPQAPATTLPPTTVPPTTVAPPAASAEDPLGAFVLWLEAVHDGDVTTALMLTGPYTRDQIDEEQATALYGELAEEWGPFREADDQVLDVAEVDDVADVAARAIVSVRATVTSDDGSEVRAAAVPLIEDEDGTWKVEWLPGGSTIEWEEAGEQVCAVFVPTFEIRLYVDGIEVEPTFESRRQEEYVAVCTTISDGAPHTVTALFGGDLALNYHASAYAVG